MKRWEGDIRKMGMGLGEEEGGGAESSSSWAGFFRSRSSGKEVGFSFFSG